MEQALLEHPAVLAAVCVAVPDPEFGSRPVAFLAVESGPLPPPDIEAHLATRLARFKHPAHYFALPATPSGSAGSAAARRHQALPQRPRRPRNARHLQAAPATGVVAVATAKLTLSKSPTAHVAGSRRDTLPSGASGVPTMNFNTTNNTFRQLMGNGLSYRVPLFQRDYSWGPDEWDDLWQDIVALFDDDPEPAHYMGYLVLQSRDNRAFDIIDGQQRMTTLSLLMLAAISHLSDLAAPDDPSDPQIRRAEQLRASYIGYLDPVSLVPRSKLTLNRHNDSFYQNYLVPLERLPQRGLNASEHLLRRALSWFKERIKDRSQDDGTAVASFVDGAVDKLFFTVITVTDELNAFKVFETLNARGVRLSATDLLKNYLFSVVARGDAHESEINALERRWEGIVGLLESESLPEFLRVYWNSRNRLVRKADLFKTIRSAVDDRGSAFALVRDLDRQARVYAALRNPDDGSWSAEERAGLSQLQMFNVHQPLALLLAAFERFSEQDRIGFARVLRAVVVVSLRYNLVCGRQSNEQESVYNQIAVAISEQRIDNPGAAIEQLQPVYPQDNEFRAAFIDMTLRTTSSRNKKVARFVLFQLERRASGRSFDFESARYDLEHVLPESPGEDWQQFDDQRREACTYRLGNLTLLTATHNRDAGNSGYSGKASHLPQQRVRHHPQARRGLRHVDPGQDPLAPGMDGPPGHPPSGASIPETAIPVESASFALLSPVLQESGHHVANMILPAEEHREDADHPACVTEGHARGACRQSSGPAVRPSVAR